MDLASKARLEYWRRHIKPVDDAALKDLMASSKTVSVKASELITWVQDVSKIATGVRRAMYKLEKNAGASPIFVKQHNGVLIVVHGHLAAKKAQRTAPDVEIEVHIIDTDEAE